MSKMIEYLRDESGASAAEYALILAIGTAATTTGRVDVVAATGVCSRRAELR